MSAQFQQYLAEELPLGPPNIRTQTPSHDNPPLSLYPWLEPAAHINPASDGTESQATGWENELRSCQEIGFLLPDIMDLYPSYEDMSIYQCERRPISFDTEHVHPAMLPLQGQEPSFSSDQRQRSQPKDSMTPRNLTRSAAKQESTRRQHRVQKQPIPRLTRRTTKAPHLPRTPCPIPGCEVTVARPTDIRRHLSTRHGGERYACLLCAAERGNTNRVEHLYGTKYNLLEHVSKIHPAVPEDNQLLAHMRSMKEFFPSESEYPATTASSISPIEPEVVEMPQESSTSSDDGHILNPIEDMQYSSWSAPTNIGEIDFFSAEPERTAGLIYDVEALIEQALRQDVEAFRASAAFSYFGQSLALPITSGVASFDNHQYL